MRFICQLWIRQVLWSVLRVVTAPLLGAALIACGTSPSAVTKEDDAHGDHEQLGDKEETQDTNPLPTGRVQIPGQVVSTTDVYPWPVGQGNDEAPTRQQCLERALPSSASLNDAHQKWGRDLLEMRNQVRDHLNQDGNPNLIVDLAATFGVCGLHYSNQAITVLPFGLAQDAADEYGEWVEGDVVIPTREAIRELLREVVDSTEEGELSANRIDDWLIISDVLEILNSHP